MKRITSRHAAAILFMSILIGVASWLHYHEYYFVVSPPSTKKIMVPEEQAFWKKEIQRVGGIQAWNTFKNTYGNEPNRFTVHERTHIFGGALFDVEGVAAAAVCDDSFESGCQHEFFGKVITASGLSILPALEKVCLKGPGELSHSCPHGIGHGIYWYLGDAHLAEALTECTKLSDPRYIFACETGVFMENDFHLMTNPDDTGWRTFDPAKPHELCDSDALKAYASACYFESPLWWLRAYHKNYTEIGNLCGELQDNDVRRSCFRGVGHWALIQKGYDVPKTIAVCDLMPSREDSIYCRERAMEIFVSGSTLKNKDFPLFCTQDLSENEQKICEKEIHRF